MEDPQLPFKPKKLSEDFAENRDFFIYFIAPVLFVIFLLLLVACFTNS